MWKHRFGYLLLWISAFALYIFYVGYTSYFLFLLVSIMPFLSILYLCLGMRRFEVRLHIEQSDFKRNEEVKVQLYTRTRSFIPLARVQGSLRINNVFTKQSTREQTAFTSERGLSEITLTLEPKSCGYYELCMDSFRLHDLLGIVRFSKKCKAETSFYVLPNPVSYAFEIPSMTKSQDEEYDPYRAGNDPGETFDVHTYQPGDSLHKIHWKLSAKLDDIMVRDFSMPASRFLTIAYELYGSMEDAQKILEHVYGFSSTLLAQGHSHTMKRYVGQEVISQVSIQSSQELLAYLKKMLAQPLSLSQTDALPELSNPQESMFYIKKNGLRLSEKKGEAHGETRS